MNKVEVTIEEVRESAASRAADNQPSVVIETEATVNGRLHDAAIEVRDVDAPAVAAALLNIDADGPVADAADLPIALHCLAVGVVHGAGRGRVRLHLQFESGQVLPVEMSEDAALALAQGLGANFARPG